MKYRFDPAAESMSRAKIAALQLKRLRQTVKNAYENVPLHRKRMRKLGIEPGDIKLAATTCAQLPFTLKSDLRDHYPFGMFARPRAEARAPARLLAAPPASRPWSATREGHRHLGGPDGALDGLRRRAAGRRGAQRLRLRPVHRRPRRALRRRAARRHGGADVRRLAPSARSC